jgi:RES domain-containing protein
MILWRLSGEMHARTFDGGYGLLFDGRWNTVGHAVTYCATSPSLCVLEKLVHVQDPDLLPELVMVRYEAPDGIGLDTIALAALPDNWRLLESWTQQRGDAWHAARAAPLLSVPSAIVPLEGSPDMNVVINHQHPAVTHIRTIGAEPFVLDARLF